MCLASWATELATHSEAIRATITANGAAPPAKENPSGIEKAVAMAGAMNVIDWKRIPPNPTAPRRSSCGCPAAPGPGTGGTPTVAMSNLPGPWWPNYARSGYIPLWAAAVADFLATGINKYVGVWNAAPALAQIEATAVRWLCDLFGYPAEARGILTSGGSLSNFSAIVAARRSLLPEDFLAGTIYVTDQVHASVTKSAMLAGFPQRSIRVVPRDAQLCMEPSALRQ